MNWTHLMPQTRTKVLSDQLNSPFTYFLSCRNILFIDRWRNRYATDITTDCPLEFLREPSEKPWCLVYQHKAPHRPFLPPPRFAQLYDDVEIPYPATFDDDYAARRVAGEAEDMRFDVSLAGDYKYMPRMWDAKAQKRWLYRRFVKDYYGAIAAVGENLGKVLEYLEEKELLDILHVR